MMHASIGDVVSVIVLCAWVLIFPVSVAVWVWVITR